MSWASKLCREGSRYRLVADLVVLMHYFVLILIVSFAKGCRVGVVVFIREFYL
jgi:uncharacterized membrane protein (DUF485 family)